MEPFENSETPSPASQEPAVPQPESTVYRAAGTGRKESPYANSPYEMPNREQPVYRPEPPKKPKKEKAPRKPMGRTFLAIALTVALVAGSCCLTAALVNDYWEERTEETVEMLTDKIEALQSKIGSAPVPGVALPTQEGAMTPAQLYSRCVNSVVAISTTVQTTSFYGPTQGSSSGSGFILTADGYVVTNYHVVENATAIDVILHDDTQYAAQVVGYDATNDIAVLKVEAENLPAAAIGSSNALIIGDMVAAIGNPLGELASTQTIGYVSGINREVATDNTIISMIQTDAAINPGNSGGPLFNMYGQVIGVTTAKYSGTTGSGASIEGIGFAIPIDDVMPIINDLIDYGYVTGAYMGVTVRNTDEQSAAMYGLPTGAYIEGVEEGGAAQRAGIQPKDIVIQLGEHKVSNITDLTRALRNFKAGDVTTVKLLRSGKEMTLDITLDEKPHDTAPAAESDPAMPSEGDPNAWYDYYFRRFFGE